MTSTDDFRRVYEPHECDAVGVPLDWEECRQCRGAGEVQYSTTPHIDPRDPACETREDPCGDCDGHGSLKAAALAYFRQTACAACGSEKLRDVCAEADRVVFGCRPGGRDLPYRCQDCGHPMSDGEWVGEFGDEILRDDLLRKPHNDLHQWAERSNLVHYSSCDDGCRHGGPLRCNTPSDLTAEWDTSFPTADADVLSSLLAARIRVEASWRSVDVRTLGWPHDLRHDHLAVLCLRCFSQKERSVAIVA